MNNSDIKEIEQIIFMVRQKISVARDAKSRKQLGLYKYSVESAEGMIEFAEEKLMRI